MTFSVEQVRADFPVLNREVNGQPLVYLDSAASAQKPEAVIGAEAEFYRHGYAAVHRGIHTLSAEATARMEAVRQQAATFLNAGSAEEVVFVRGTTEGINLVANSWGNANVGAGDNIIISEMEHHANIVPWQMLCARVGAELRVIPLNPDGTLQLDVVPGLFDPRTRLLAITEVSNVLGTENPLAALIALAHQHGAKVLVDGAQAVMHHPVDVQALGCDFYVFSAHKLYGPTGIGVLYARSELLQTMAPWEGGGSMIATVSLTEGTTWNQAPWRFEAGTPNTGGIMRDAVDGPVSGTGYVSGIAGDVQYHGRGGPPGGRPPADPQTVRVKDGTMAALPDKDKLLRNFSRCANWEEKYLYIIELGQRLAPLSPEEHSVQNIIQGCQSQVWIVMDQDPTGVITLRGDSDAAIVKGLIAVVFILYDRMTAQDITEFDVRPWFEKMALTQHLTPSRSQGLEAMIRAIRAKAANIS